ncbi:hypothetical protein ACSBR1_016324 [Camellia fascicularis]
MNRCLVLFVRLESLRKRPIQTFKMASQSACNMRLTGIEDTTELLEKQLALEMSKMTLEEALTLVRAFSHYLTLMGVAETHHRVQKSWSMAHLSKSCDDFFNQLIHGGVSPDELYNNVCIQLNKLLDLACCVCNVGLLLLQEVEIVTLVAPAYLHYGGHAYPVELGNLQDATFLNVVAKIWSSYACHPLSFNIQKQELDIEATQD